MSITQFGRVEFDPMRIPTPARTSTKDIPSFDEQFQSEIAQGNRFKTASPDKIDEQSDEAIPNQQSPGKQESIAPEIEHSKDPSEPVEAAVSGPTAQILPDEDQEPEQQGTTNGGASARRKSAGKGVEAPAISPEDGASAPGGRTLPSSTNSSELLSQLGIANSAQQSQGATEQAGIRSDGVAFKEIGASAHTRAKSPLAGYKTVNKYSLQQAEAARESIFKQIAIRLKADGGEMVLRLDPPELGKLDLQMRIENHSEMHLVIRTEHPEMATLLEKHMGELEQALQLQGITITGTEVHHSGQQGASEAQDNFLQHLASDLGGDVHDEEELTNQLDTIRPGSGFITADSLDFWA